ncbi:DUF2786 domain-containing protein [Actinocorallia lasiicapitis]
MTDPHHLIIEALTTDDLRRRDGALAVLGADPAAYPALWSTLTDARTAAESRGWQPDDLRRHLLRFHTPHHAALLTETGGDGAFERWARTEGIERFEGVDMLLETVGALRKLPRIARLQRAERADHPALGRVRALLAKAESTEFPAEAEALVARAQEIMARYSIASVEEGGSPTGMRLPVDNPYEEAKATLLHVVAEANRCRAVWQAELGFSTVLGFPADLDAVELLYTSLLLQADTAMPKNGSKKRFRQAFLTSFAHRIGERLTRTAQDVVTDDLLPILAERNQAVEQAVDNLFPQLKTVRSRAIQDLDGWHEGRRAADAADLN